MKKISIMVFFALFLVFSLNAETFRFSYREGEKYRILSEVEEDVYINGVYSHTAHILNKIAIEVTETRGSSGKIEAEFITSERSSGHGEVYEWSESYESIFWRDELGRYDIDDSYYMPVVRNVPSFPAEDISVGDSWAADGWEVHDFRKNFNLPEPFSFPINVFYTYRGEVTKADNRYDQFQIEYTVFHRVRKTYPELGLYPVRLSGSSKQELLWDRERGRPYSYEEVFNFIFTLSSGATVEYIGTAKATVIRSEKLDKDKVAEGIKKELEEKGIGDTEVRSDEEGVTISLENIQFLPDSAVLRDSEKKKLIEIADILMKHRDRDLLITGHTALAGTERGRQLLSEQRAKAVADFLLELDAANEKQVMVRGYGAKKPISDNSTEEGMRRNRRVEIKILEN